MIDRAVDGSLVSIFEVQGDKGKSEEWNLRIVVSGSNHRSQIRL